MLRPLQWFVYFALTASFAFAQVRPVATISFDDGFDGLTPTGSLAAETDENPSLAPGRTGQALKSGPGTGYVSYPTAGIVGPEAGTVEMWVCALDWQPADEEFHCFFDTRGEGALYLYKYYQGTDLLMLSCGNLAGPYYSSRSALNWQPGEWHHIAGTWGPEGVRSYVDGRPAGAGPVEGALPATVGERFIIGDHPWHLPRSSSSLIDEVRLYDRALSPAHIAAHFRGDDEFVAPLTAEGVSLRYELDPEEGRVTVVLSTGGADTEDARLSAQVAILAEGADFPMDRERLGLTGGRLSETLVLPSIEPGNYEVVARLYLDGEPVTEARRALVIPGSDWVGNTLGLEDRVLPPWTPLETRDGAVSCWGREYLFEGMPLPRQILSAGEALLSGPPALVATGPGGHAAWRPVAGETVSSPAGTRVTTTGSVHATAGPPVRLQYTTTVEYDGLVMVELSIPDSRSVPLEGLRIELPVKPERAIYRHRWAPSWEGVSGNLPAESGVVDQSGFIPYYWLGDNDRGLFWFCESDEMWPNAAAENAIEVERSAEAVVLRLNLLAPGQKLPDNWRFSFGLQATPVRPIPKDWRKWRLQPGVNGNVQIMWPTPADSSLRYFGYPEATDPTLFAKEVGQLQEEGTKAVPYLCLSYLSAACPEWAFHRKRWAMGGVDSSSSDVAAYGAGFAQVSPLGEGYADFIVWKTKQFIDDYGIDGLYHDNTHPYPSSNLAAGVGYGRDDTAHKTYPILGYRALYRRMYGVLKSLPRETFSMAHMSGKVTIPILAYEDSYLDGEHFRGRVKDNYLDLMSLDTFRAEFMGRQWGIMPYFLPEFPPEYRTQVAPTRGLMALLMLHDVAVWPLWCNAEVANEALGALDQFGYVDSEFVPYFDPSPPAETETEDVLVSAYRRSDGATLLVIGNLSREDWRGRVRINAERLGVALETTVDWPSAEAVEVAEGELELSVPGLGYRMVMIGAR